MDGFDWFSSETETEMTLDFPTSLQWRWWSYSTKQCTCRAHNAVQWYQQCSHRLTLGPCHSRHLCSHTGSECSYQRLPTNQQTNKQRVQTHSHSLPAAHGTIHNHRLAAVVNLANTQQLCTTVTEICTKRKYSLHVMLRSFGHVNSCSP